MAVTVDDASLRRALEALRGYQTCALGTVSAAGPHVAGVFFAAEAVGADGLRLLLAVLRDSRKHRELLGDPRVAFMCSPGAPTRWVQGDGTASCLDGSAAEGSEVLSRLVALVPAADVFVGRLPVVPVVVSVRRLKVVEELGRPALVLDLGPVPDAS